MCCKSFWLKIIPFLLTFYVSLAVCGVLQTNIASGNQSPPNLPNKVESVRIVSKTSAKYTSSARENQTEGVVNLRVTFLATGEIGSISVADGLPDGLTDQAIAAAKQIKFEPAKVNGIPQTVTKLVQYSFTIY